MSVAVHVLGGFLGAGKTTTLLARIRCLAGRERVAVLVNDVGDSGFDGIRVEEAGDGLKIAQIEGACVCCTAPAGFVDAVGRLLEEVRPDRLFVEPTGLARPADLIDTLRRAPYADRLDLQPLIVLVDPRRLDAEASARLPLLREQAEAADVLVAHREDQASDEQLERFRSWAATLWPGPLRVLSAAHGDLPEGAWAWPAGCGPRQARPVLVEDHSVEHSAHGAGQEHGFARRSWRWTADVVFSRERLLDALARLATGAAGAELLRLKGMFRTEEGVVRLEVAGGDVVDRPSAYRRDSRVDLIMMAPGSSALDRAGSWLDEARLSAEELEAMARGLELVHPDGRRLHLDRGVLDALPGAVPDVSVLIPRREGRAASMAALLDQVEADPGWQAVVVAADGYATDPVPVAVLREGLLLHTLDGEPLPEGRGGPIRLLIPEERAPQGPCSNVKGVVRIALREPGS